ncbi:hypothetical protein MPTK1_7g15480 [Marchantia polymorpha subsp. ruderalis]|nr:hypothetical protein MARPO_0009s0232 [Marchantia polymorpha]BBN17574.1 hypothetical protein Mp_7g15480 [Marchantia polymorpha subsp. ruderalis]|eukprot:PTQ47180.1 hypothetical protein MARPO_0009s0232 [Marchantia polymorpha]
MNKTKDQEELQTFGSNFTPKRRSLFQSKSFNPGGIDQMFVSVNKPQVPNREDWSHLTTTSTEQNFGSPLVAPKRVTSSPAAESATNRSVVKTMKDDEEKNSTLKLRLEAMTWAAMAKDATILALQQRLKAALLSLQNERDANAQLKVELEMSGKEVRPKQQQQPSEMQREGDSQPQSEKDAASALQQQQLGEEEEDREQEASVLDSDKQLNPSEFRSSLVLDSQQQRQASGFPI